MAGNTRKVLLVIVLVYIFGICIAQKEPPSLHGPPKAKIDDTEKGGKVEKVQPKAPPPPPSPAGDKESVEAPDGPEPVDDSSSGLAATDLPAAPAVPLGSPTSAIPKSSIGQNPKGTKSGVLQKTTIAPAGQDGADGLETTEASSGDFELNLEPEAANQPSISNKKLAGSGQKNLTVEKNESTAKPGVSHKATIAPTTQDGFDDLETTESSSGDSELNLGPLTTNQPLISKKKLASASLKNASVEEEKEPTTKKLGKATPKLATTPKSPNNEGEEIAAESGDDSLLVESLSGLEQNSTSSPIHSPLPTLVASKQRVAPPSATPHLRSTPSIPQLIPGGPSLQPLDNGLLPPVLARANPNAPKHSTPKVLASSGPPKLSRSTAIVPKETSEEASEEESGSGDVDQIAESLATVLISAVNDEYAAALKNLTDAKILTEADYESKHISDLFALLLENLVNANPAATNEKEQRQLVHKAALEFQQIFKAKAASGTKNVSEIVKALNEQILASPVEGGEVQVGIQGTVKPFDQNLINKNSSKNGTSKLAQKAGENFETPPPFVLTSAEPGDGAEETEDGGAGDGASASGASVNNLQTLHLLKNANANSQNKSISVLSISNQELSNANVSLQKGDNFPAPPTWKQPIESASVNETDSAEIESSEEKTSAEISTVQALPVLPNITQSGGSTKQSFNVTNAVTTAPSTILSSLPSINQSISSTVKPNSTLSSLPIAANGTDITTTASTPLAVDVEVAVPNNSTDSEPEPVSEPASGSASESSSNINDTTSALSTSAPQEATTLSTLSTLSEKQSDHSTSTLSTQSISHESSNGTAGTTESFWINSESASPEPTPTGGKNSEEGASPEPKSTTAQSNAVMNWNFKIVDPETEWDSELANKDSFQYKTLYGSLLTDLKTMFKKLEPQRFVGISIKRFSQGSVVVEGETELKERVESAQFLENFLKLLTSQENKIGGRIVDPVSVSFDGRPNVGSARVGSNNNGTPAWVIGIAVAAALLAAVIIAATFIIVRTLRNRRSSPQGSAVDAETMKSSSPPNHNRYNKGGPRGSIASSAAYDTYATVNTTQEMKETGRGGYQPDQHGRRPDNYYRQYQPPYVAPALVARTFVAPPNYYSPYYQQHAGAYGYY